MSRKNSKGHANIRGFVDVIAGKTVSFQFDPEVTEFLQFSRDNRAAICDAFFQMIRAQENGKFGRPDPSKIVIAN